MMPHERLRMVGRHLWAIFWIYVRFIVLAVIIFYLVQWYIREYDGGETEETGEQSATKPASGKDEL